MYPRVRPAMSTTNRAFIKAYRQDAADQSPAGGNSPAMLNQSAAPTREGATRTITATTSVAGPVRPSFEPPRTGPKKPLSSFIARPQSPVQAAQNEEANFLEPGTTVASFQWPKVCRTLNQHSGPQLDRVADLLRAQASAGHSLVGVMGLFPRVGTTTAALCLA